MVVRRARKSPVIGSAGQLAGSSGAVVLVRGPNFAISEVIVDIINEGRRPITVSEVGFLQANGRHQFTGQPGQLPKRLEQGEKETVFASVDEDLLGSIKSGIKLVPYCRDAEGRFHKGKPDEHFRRFVRSVKNEGEKK